MFVLLIYCQRTNPLGPGIFNFLSPKNVNHDALIAVDVDINVPSVRNLSKAD